MRAEDVAEQVLTRLAALESLPLLVAIDGHSAAGKTTLARALQASGEATIVHIDDFYRPLEPSYRETLDAADGCAEYYDWQRLEDQVLQPLRAGRTARFRKYDWSSNQLVEWAEVGPFRLTIVEGCYSARPELRAYYDFIVLVVSAPGERQRRQKQRNDASQAWLDRWDAAERYYLEHLRPNLYADLVVPGGFRSR
jgi:uridine kinase